MEKISLIGNQSLNLCQYFYARTKKTLNVGRRPLLVLAFLFCFYLWMHFSRSQTAGGRLHNFIVSPRKRELRKWFFVLFSTHNFLMIFLSFYHSPATPSHIPFTSFLVWTDGPMLDSMTIVSMDPMRIYCPIDHAAGSLCDAGPQVDFDRQLVLVVSGESVWSLALRRFSPA